MNSLFRQLASAIARSQQQRALKNPLPDISWHAQPSPRKQAAIAARAAPQVPPHLLVYGAGGEPEALLRLPGAQWEHWRGLGWEASREHAIAAVVALANDHNITLTSKPIDDAIVAAPEDFETADVPDEARVIVLVPNGKDWPRQRSSIAIERCEVEVYDAGPGQAIGSMIGMALTSRDYPDLWVRPSWRDARAMPDDTSQKEAV